jgi:hypothetical protein
VQAMLQQTPSAHTVLAHSAPLAHVSPMDRPTHVPLLQTGVFPLQPPQQLVLGIHEPLQSLLVPPQVTCPPEPEPPTPIPPVPVIPPVAIIPPVAGAPPVPDAPPTPPPDPPPELIGTSTPESPPPTPIPPVPGMPPVAIVPPVAPPPSVAEEPPAADAIPPLPPALVGVSPPKSIVRASTPPAPPAPSRAMMASLTLPSDPAGPQLF